MIQPVKMKVMSIVHGKSEYAVCSSIKSNLRLKHGIIAHKKGSLNIQVTSIMDILNDRRFCSYKCFIKEFNDVESKNKTLVNFSLFIIMDVDDCTEEQKKRFISKEMFLEHWLYDYIVPIFNDPNLEITMKKANIEITRKKDYFKIFPTNHGDLDIETAKAFSKKLKKCKCSNLWQYVNHCLSIVESSK